MILILITFIQGVTFSADGDGVEYYVPSVPVLDLPIDEWELSPDLVALQEPLGSGNFGEVYKALVTNSSGLTVAAVKVLKRMYMHICMHADIAIHL